MPSLVFIVNILLILSRTLDNGNASGFYDDVIKCSHFPRYWPFVRGIHRSPVNSPHKGQWRGALMYSLICTWTKVWANNRVADYLNCHRAHHGVTVMLRRCAGRIDDKCLRNTRLVAMLNDIFFIGQFLWLRYLYLPFIQHAHVCDFKC